MKQQKKLIDWQQNRPVHTNKIKKSVWTEIVRCIGNSIIAVLFLLSSVWMMQDVFPDMKVYASGVVLSVVVIAVFTFWNGMMTGAEQKMRRLIGNLAVLVITVFGCYLFYRNHRITMEDGGMALGQLYLDRWNEYYNTTAKLSGGDAAYLSLALSFGVFAAASLLQMLAGAFRKWWFMICLPLIVCVLELLVGYTPGVGAFILLYAGIVLGSCVFWKKIFPGKRRMIWIGVSIVLVVAAVTYGLNGPAHYIASKETQMKMVQGELEGSLKNLRVQLFHGNMEDGSVDNHTPKYNNEEVMRIHMDGSSNGGRMYLRGYYGSEYENSEWINTADAFAKACIDHGISSEEGSELLANAQYMNAMVEDAGAAAEYSIEYTGIQDPYTYALYASSYSSMKDVTLSGDYRIFKEKGKKTFSATVNQQNWDMFHWETAGENLFWYADSYGSLWSKEQEFFDWYNPYAAANYLTVPPQEVTAKKIAEEIRQSDLAELDYSDSYGNDAVNMNRMIYAQLVSSELAARGMYSLYLDSPGNQDPIEYFLSVSHKGYCVHFASAGVFILRELGVPARYTTGYITKGNGISGEDDTTDYVVEDNCAHAWVEVYLNNYGWVPMEMTPGYDDDQTKLPSEWTKSETQENNEGKETIIQRQEAQQDQQTSDTQSEELEQDETTAEKNTQSDIGMNQTSEDTGFHGQTASKDGQTLKKQKEEENSNWTKVCEWISIMIVIAGFLMSCFYLIVVRPKQKEQSWNKKLARELERGQYNQAVCQLNRKIYHMVMKKQRVQKSGLSDRQYLEILTGSFPEINRKDWEHYMEIVQKAAFSEESISSEEAQFCEKIFRALPEEGIKIQIKNKK